jgi:hypothetical protein
MGDMVTTINPVVDAINQTASNARVRLAMLMGAKLESGWRADAVGDNGNSFGPFQINIPAHPNVSSASAQDPVFASRFMLPAYEAGVNRVDPALWNSDPALAAATAAFYAERPRVMYRTDRVRSSWADVNAAWNGGIGGIGSALGLGDGTGDVNSLSNTGGPIAELGDWAWWKVYDTFGTAINKVFFGLLIGGGAITVLVGFYLMLKHSRLADVADQTTTAYSAIIGGLTRPVRQGIGSRDDQ